MFTKKEEIEKKKSVFQIIHPWQKEMDTSVVCEAHQSNPRDGGGFQLEVQASCQHSLWLLHSPPPISSWSPPPFLLV